MVMARPSRAEPGGLGERAGAGRSGRASRKMVAQGEGRGRVRRGKRRGGAGCGHDGAVVRLGSCGSRYTAILNIFFCSRII